MVLTRAHRGFFGVSILAITQNAIGFDLTGKGDLDEVAKECELFPMPDHSLKSVLEQSEFKALADPSFLLDSTELQPILGLPVIATEKRPVDRFDLSNALTNESGATVQAINNTFDKEKSNPNCEICLKGNVSFNITGSAVNLTADSIENRRNGGTSGTIRLELWAHQQPITGGTVERYTLAGVSFNPLPGGFHYPNVSVNAPYEGNPPPGCYFFSMVVLEYDGAFFYTDWQTFDDCYTVAGVQTGGCCGGGGNGNGNGNGNRNGHILKNISTNGFVDQRGMIAGFIVESQGRFVIMGENSGSLSDPMLTLTTTDGRVLDSNDDWRNHATANEVVSSLRNPGANKDAAFAITLAPGAYFARLNGNFGTGTGIVSVTHISP